MNDFLLRTEGLIGSNGVSALKNAVVALFGVGGVGSFAFEALVRSGVGTIYIYDNDTVAESNINRQLIADLSTLGRLKTEVAAERAEKINPQVKIYQNPIFVTPETSIPFEKFDYIIDAVDNVTAKLYLTEESQKRNVPIISVMGTGNKLDVSKLKISDIYKTNTCPLAKVMRLELKKRGIKKLEVVWSDEIPIKSFLTESVKSGSRPAPASMAFVPGAAGLMAASKAIMGILTAEKGS